MSDWKIRKRKDGCSRCEREFEEEEVFYSFLLIDPETIGREDRCIACFDPVEVQEDVQGTIFWRTRRPPEGKRRVAVDFDVVEQIFTALAEHDQERILELRYLMSLLLLRKKRLKLVRVVRKEGEGAGEAMILRRPRRTEAIEVQVFDLSEERSLQLRQELTRIFEGADVEDLLAAPAPPPAPPAAAQGSGDEDPEAGEEDGTPEEPRAEESAEAASPEEPETAGETPEQEGPEASLEEVPGEEAEKGEAGEAAAPATGNKAKKAKAKKAKNPRPKRGKQADPEAAEATRDPQATGDAEGQGAVDSHEHEEQTAG